MQQAQNPLSSETHLPSIATPEVLLLSSKQEEGWTRLTQRALGPPGEAEGGWEATWAFAPHLAPFKDGPSPCPTVIKPLAHHLLSFEKKFMTFYLAICV